MDFGALPPEVNSARMYAGPGAGSMLAAAAAWDGLATDLYSTANSYQSVITALTAGSWQGPASSSMAAAVAPYVTWMTATAAQCEQVANQARAAASAFETAFAMTVPPPLIAANRAHLTALVATNFLGQNIPAIAATEAQYGEMWAQDAAAVYGYAGSSAAAATLPPFTPPQQITNPSGPAGQAAAVAHAAATSAAGLGGLGGLGSAGASASVGQAGSVGTLSVPQGWGEAVSAGTTTQASAMPLPASGLGAAPGASSGGPGMPKMAVPNLSGRDAEGVFHQIGLRPKVVARSPMVG